MTRNTIPLQDLAQRISQQQAELAKLRQEYETRQTQLQKLLRRKEELQTQLRQVEAEIQGIAPGSHAPPSKPAAGGTAAKSTPTKAGTKPKGGVTLAHLVLQIVTQAGRPITVKELAVEVARRKYPTTSKNLPALVGDRVKDLVKRKLLQRAPNRQGVLPVPTQATAKAPAAKSASGAPGPKPKTPVAARPAMTSSPAASTLTLPALVTKILAASPEPLTARRLAEKVLASGYKTKSKNFAKVVAVGIWKMDNIENVPGKGYRLKRA